MLIEKLEAALAARAAQGLNRTRRVAHEKSAPKMAFRTFGADSDSRQCLQFGSNDYLGLAGDPRIAAAASCGVAQWGVGAGASHLVTGHTAAHEDLEREIAAFLSPSLRGGAGQRDPLALGERGRGEGDSIGDSVTSPIAASGTQFDQAKVSSRLEVHAHSPLGKREVPSLTPGAQFVRAGFRGQADARLQAFARELRTNQTDAEAKLWGVLRAGRWRELKFRRQHPFDAGGQQFILDFYCHERGLCIELDGGQHQELVKLDAHRDAFLAESGIKTLRFWNSEVFNEWDAVLETIWNATDPAVCPTVHGGSKTPLALGERGRGEGAPRCDGVNAPAVQSAAKRSQAHASTRLAAPTLSPSPSPEGEGK